MYSLIGKCYKDLDICEFKVKHEDNTEYLSRDRVIELASAGEIEGVHTVTDIDGKIELLVDKGLSSLETCVNENKHKMKIIGRMVNSEDKCIGYVVVGDNKKEYRLSIGKVWEMTLNHSIEGVRAVIKNDKKYLLSIDRGFLSNLHKIK